jgi:hypothetical protein
VEDHFRAIAENKAIAKKHGLHDVSSYIGVTTQL